VLPVSADEPLFTVTPADVEASAATRDDADVDPTLGPLTAISSDHRDGVSRKVGATVPVTDIAGAAHPKMPTPSTHNTPARDVRRLARPDSA